MNLFICNDQQIKSAEKGKQNVWILRFMKIFKKIKIGKEQNNRVISRLHETTHLFNKRGAWNKRGGGAKVAKSLNVELGINEEGGIFGKN